MEGSNIKKIYSLYNPKLKSLNISRTLFSDVYFLPLFKIETLKMDEMNIFFFKFNQIPSIKELSVVKTDFHEYSKRFFIRLMPNLEELHIGQSFSLKSETLEVLKSLKKITYLDGHKKINRNMNDPAFSHIEFTKVTAP